MFRRNQSTVASALPAKREPTQAYQIPEGGIHPATTAEVGSQGKALDTDDLIIFLVVFGVVWTVAVGAYSTNKGWPLGVAVVVWTVGGLLLGTLLLFIQSRTWVQTWNSTLHWSNERLRVKAQERVLTYYYECEVEREKIRADAQVQIAEINERLRIAAQAERVRQVEEHSITQSTMNQLANYVPPSQELEPFRDELRDELLRYLVGLYETGMEKDGRIKIAVPWSARGKMNTDKVLDLFSQAKAWSGYWVVKQAENKHWYVNVERFTTPGQLVRAFDKAHTMGD
jgi:hypothetical protein